MPEFIKGYYVDYSFLIKIPGPNHNYIAMLGDFHASGNKGLAHFITNPASIKAFESQIKEKYGYFPDFFEMVVKVTSYDYYDFNTEVIYFKPLEN